MLMFPAIDASDPIRQRRPSQWQDFFGNILDEAMRPLSASNFDPSVA
jgi:hypothetical protein